MSQAIDTPPPVNIAGFDRFIASISGDGFYELIGGEIVAMTDPTVAHAIIVGNIGRPLGSLMRARGCHAAQGGVHIQSREDGHGLNKPRPDLMAFCPPIDQRRNFVTNPLVVVEVLSPGSLDTDRGLKLRFYKHSVPTLRHIALVYQDQMRVEHFHRDDTGWVTEVLTTPEAILHFNLIGFSLALSAIYDAIEF